MKEIRVETKTSVQRKRVHGALLNIFEIMDRFILHAEVNEIGQYCMLCISKESIVSRYLTPSAILISLCP